MNIQELLIYGISGAIVAVSLACLVVMFWRQWRGSEVDAASWDAGVATARSRHHRHYRPDSWLTVVARPRSWFGPPACELPGKHTPQHFTLITGETAYSDANAAALDELLITEEQRDCTHHWPGELLPDAPCTFCGLRYSEWELV